VTSVKPRLSILVLTYNHQRYLAQAFKGVQRQKVNFPYELVIANDCSSDGTAEVVESWRDVFGERMRVLPRPKNLGITRNFVNALAACRGPYVAILEGDDYWTDPRKLQRQHDFLASNPDCSACCHRVKLLLDDGTFTEWTPLQGTKPKLEFVDVLVENFVPGCSTLMFRNNPKLEVPGWLVEINFYDWVLNVLNAERGNLGFIEDRMSVYRVHSNGAWSGKSTREQVAAVCDILDRLNQHYDRKFDPLIRAHKRIWQHQMTIRLLEDEVHSLRSGRTSSLMLSASLPARIVRRLRANWKKLALRPGRKAA
jgi:glycosyltransferase involved in cell wall biosynthesis